MWIIFTEQCERITQVAHDNRATVIELLRSLTKNECLWVICSGCSPKMSKWGNHLFFRNKWFAQKTYEPISNPVIQYKTKCVLMLWLIVLLFVLWCCSYCSYCLLRIFKFLMLCLCGCEFVLWLSFDCLNCLIVFLIFHSKNIVLFFYACLNCLMLFCWLT